MRAEWLEDEKCNGCLNCVDLRMCRFGQTETADRLSTDSTCAAPLLLRESCTDYQVCVMPPHQHKR